jgi:Tfp pilus assembly protein PilE
MASVKAYLAGLVALAVVAAAFAVLWFMAYTNYTGLETKYANLQSRYQTLQTQYNTLEANYTTLNSNYNSLQILYQTLQSQYNSLQSQYSSLQSNYITLQGQYQALQLQYNSLQNQYSELNNTCKLNNTYWVLLTFLGQDVWQGTLEMDFDLPREMIVAPIRNFSYGWSGGLGPDRYIRTWVVVPSNYSATIEITVNASSPVEVFVFDLYNYMQWLEGYSPTYYLYDQGTYINDQVSVGSGLYIIVIYNPSSTLGIDTSGSVTVTFTQSSG